MHPTQKDENEKHRPVNKNHVKQKTNYNIDDITVYSKFYKNFYLHS